MILKVALKKPKRLPPSFNDHMYPWASCAPFVDNKRAMLIHRPRAVITFTHRKTPYISIQAWCGNHFTGDDKFTFLDFLPTTGKLLCARCEAMATKAGLPSADELNGQHVHLGKLFVKRTCHHNKEE